MPSLPEPRVVAAFAAIYLVWGSTFLAIAWAVETIPPFPMMAARCLVGGGILLGLSRLREPDSAWPTPAEWLGSGAVGLFLFVGCHAVLAREEQFVPSGISALCLATIPLFVPLLAWGFLGSGRPSSRTALALLAAFLGVALLVAGKTSGGGLSATDAALLLLAAFSWAAGTIATRRVPLPGSPMAAAGAPLLVGGLVLVAVSFASGEAQDLRLSQVSGRSLVGLLYLVLLGTVVTFTAYIWLLGHVAPARVATYAFVNPVVAVFLGWALPGEQREKHRGRDDRSRAPPKRATGGALLTVSNPASGGVGGPARDRDESPPDGDACPHGCGVAWSAAVMLVADRVMPSLRVAMRPLRRRDQRCTTACHASVTAMAPYGPIAASTAAAASGDRQNALKADASGRIGTLARRRTNQERSSGAPGIATGISEPEASSAPAAWADSRVMPRPTRTACLTAPWEPSVSVERGAIPASTRNASTVARVPDPRSRSRQVSSAGSATGWSAAATTTRR